MKQVVVPPGAKVTCVIGPPGAGKGTLCQRLAKQSGMVHISVGDLCREHVAKDTVFGKRLRAFVEGSKFVPDEILLELLNDRLQQQDAMSRGVLLDGFPRTVKQARLFLAKSPAEIQRILLLQAPDEVCLQRILFRRVDSETQEIYNEKSFPAPKKVLGRLVQRDGDGSEQRIRQRLEVFHTEIGQILLFFQGRIQAVNSVRGVNEILADVTKLLSEAPPAVKQEDGSKSKQKKDNAQQCVVCLSNSAEFLVVPCGHQCGCQPCLSKLEKKKGPCPICRGAIQGIVRVFRSGFDDEEEAKPEVEAKPAHDAKAEKDEDDGGWGEEERKKLAEARLLDDDLGIAISAAPCEEVAKGSSNIGVTIQVADVRNRIPVDICCVVDISGSMNSDAKFQDPNDETKQISEGFSQLDIVKHSVKTVMHSLTSEDRLSIVAFDSKAETVVPLTPMSEDRRKLATEALEALRPRGNTNIWAGLEAGLESLRVSPQQQDEKPRRSYIFLLTDGQPNESPPEGEPKSLAAYLDSHPDFECQVNTFGFGYQLNSALLHGISVVGKGTFGFIPDAKIVGPCFVSATANALSSLSQTCLVHLSPKNGAKLTGRVLGDYAVSETSWGRVVYIGSLQYGQSRDLVCPVQIPPNLPPNTPYMTVTVEYANPLGGPHRKVSYDVTSRQVTSDAIAAFARGIVVSAGMEVLQQKADAENIMKTLVGDVGQTLRKIPKDERAVALNADVSGRMSKAVSTKERFNRWGKHYLYALVRAHQLQVRTNILDPGLQVYGGTLFKKAQSIGEETFKTLPLKKSKEPITRRISQPVQQQQVQQAPVDNSTYYGGGCFGGSCNVLMGDNSWKAAAHVKKGDRLTIAGHCTAVVQCVVRVAITGQQIVAVPAVKTNNPLVITGGHPVRIDGHWTKPQQLAEAKLVKLHDQEYLYNYVLDIGHVVNVEGFECCTLGHGLTGQTIAHPFYGTKKVLDLLATLKGWEEGRVTVEQSLHQLAKKSGVCT